jgi:hypothetical protein
MANRTDSEAVIKLVINGKQADATLKELTDSQRKLNAQLTNMKASDPGYAKMKQEVIMLAKAERERRLELKGLKNDTDELALSWKSIAAGVAGGFGISAGIGMLQNFGAQVFETTAKFQKMEAVLTTTLGSKSAAQLSMKQIQQLASETPYAVEELTEAYVKLANRGFKPTMEQMRQMGDLAASTGKSFDQLVEAALDAETGEFERLKEFGIRASKHGDQVAFTFKGVTTEIENTSEAIREYVIGLGDAEGISGAMAGISETLEGKVSNLGDSWDSMLKTVGGETQGVFSGAIDIMGEAITSLNKYLTNLSLAQKYKASGTGFWEQTRGLIAKSQGGIDMSAVQRDAFASVSNSLDTSIGSAKNFKDLLAIQDDVLGRMKRVDRATQEGAAAYQLYSDKLKMVKEAGNGILNDREQKKLAEESKAANLAAAAKAKAAKEAEKAAKKEESAKKTALKEFEQLDKAYKKLELSRLDDQLSKNQKEIAQEGEKYDALIEKEREFLNKKGVTPEQKKATETKIAKIEDNKTNAVNDLAVRQEAEMNDKIKQLREQLSQIKENELQKEQNTINKFYDEQEKLFAGNQPKLDQLKLDRVQDLTDAEIREKERLEKEKARIEAEYETLVGTKPEQKIAKINKQYDDELIALKKSFSDKLIASAQFEAAKQAIETNRKAAIELSEKDDADKQKEKAHQIKETAIEGAQAVSDAVFTIAANNRQRETDIKLNALDKEREKELSQKNLSEKQKAAINKKFDAQEKAIKLKAWKDDKKAALAQAVINGALAVTKALPNIPLAVASGVAAAAQIAVIIAEKPPEFATGVRNFKGGPAIVGEAGTELVEEQGKLWLAEKATLANLAPGANVYNAQETASMVNASLGEKIYQPVNYSVDYASARTAENQYRSTSTAPAITPPATVSSTDKKAKDAVQNQIDTMSKALTSFMTEQSRINALPVNLNYRLVEEMDKEIKQVRVVQGG